MSLINDALKRTKEAQQQHAPIADGPALRPAEPVPAQAGKGAKSLLFIMVAAVIFGNLLLVLAFRDRGSKSEPVAAAQNPVPQPAAPAAPAAPAPAVAPAVAAPLTPAVIATPVEPAPAPTPAPVAVEPAPAPEVAAAPAEPAPAVVFVNPPPAPLRLQSIIYNPARPSAMIGGKFLFVGDRIQGHQVIAISKETVTLVGDGQTNVLSLP